MNRNETAFLKRPKRTIRVQVLSDHHPYPAVTIRQSGKPRIVKRSEIMTSDEYALILRERKIEQAMVALADFILAWTESKNRRDWQALGETLKIPAGAVWHKHRKAKRLGLIT